MKLTITHAPRTFEDLLCGDLFIKGEDLFMRTDHGAGNAISLTGERQSLYNNFACEVEVRRVKEVTLTLE